MIVIYVNVLWLFSNRDNDLVTLGGCGQYAINAGDNIHFYLGFVLFNWD